MDPVWASTQLFWTFLVVLFRIAGLMVTAPVFGSPSVPVPVKLGFSTAFAIALTPTAVGKVGSPPDDWLTLVGVLLGETLLGMLTGYLVSLFFSAVQMAGAFIDMQMGYGIFQLMNPFTPVPASLLAQFHTLLMMVVYLQVNAHHWLLAALAQSLQALPPGGVALDAGRLQPLLSDVIVQVFALALRIAAPATAVLIVVDAALAIVSRAVPQMPVFFVGAPAKIAMGLLTLAIVLPLVANVFVNTLPMAAQDILDMLGALAR
ncbi:MAG: flagellar biosynthetic protein FliR [Chthonomonadetes bacterium]|nr:flagellar biosynthetic protein FliR [Chthonomonadetes bacterium]